MNTLEDSRAAALLQAQEKANELFHAVESKGLIRPNIPESKLNQEIYDLANEMYGISTYWHKRIVRAGRNTLAPYDENPPDLTLGEDDILFLDLGPVFEEWEADIGKTYALGSDARKQALVAELPRQFEKVQAHYRADPNITGAALYEFAQNSAVAAGWRFGGRVAGHIVSEFAHAMIPGDKDLNRIGPNNPRPMSDPDGLDRPRHWILEIHLVDPAGAFGGFYERLL
jgi:Xaa-Pro dipeptidase